MEEFLADSSTISVIDNNNVTDNLEILKQNQSSTLETNQQIDSLVKEQEIKVDDLLNLNDQIDNTAKFESLIENKDSDELIKELTDQPNESTDQLNEQINNSLIELKNTTESNDLSESTIQLLEDLNDTVNTNTLDSTKNTTNSEHSSTVEGFLEQSTEMTSNNVLINNLLGNNQLVEDLATDSIQSQPEAANLNQITQESLLDQLNNSELTNKSISEVNLADLSSTQINSMDISNPNETTQGSLLNQSKNSQVLNSDDNELTNESIPVINLADQSLTQEISLVNILDENISNNQIEEKEQSLLDQINKTEETDKPNLLNALVNDKEDKSEFLEDLTEKMDKKIDELISDFKPEETNQTASEQLKDQVKLTLEDFVTKNEEIKTEEPKNDNLPNEEETIIVKNLDQCKLSSDELKNDSKEVEEKDKPEVLDEKINLNLDNQEAVSSKSKAEDILTQSQELLRKADKLIAEKRNSINEVNIPGLDVKISPELIIEEKTEDIQKQSAKEPETHLSDDIKQPQTNQQASENSKSQKNSKKCVIS